MDAAEAGDHGRVAVVEGDTGAGVEAGDGGFERLKDLAAQLDGTTVTIAADVTDRDTLVAAADQVEQQLGGADVLVNNAGVMLLGPFGSTQREETRRMVEVNLLGAMTATEVFLDQLRWPGQHLLRRRWGPPELATPPTRPRNGA